MRVAYNILAGIGVWSIIHFVGIRVRYVWGDLNDRRDAREPFRSEP